MRRRFRPSRRLGAELKPDTAAHLLANVFHACNRTPNSVPLEALCSYSRYRKERYMLQRTLVIVMLALFLLLPALFVPARIDVQPLPSDGGNPVYEVSVSTLLPIRQIQARMDGRTVPLYELASYKYLIQPGDNGEIELSATLLNRQRSSARFTVSGVDADAPELVRTELIGSRFYLYLRDEGSGVDYAGVRVSAADGSERAVDDWDAEEGWIAIVHPQEALDLRIPDARGNVLHLRLTPEA